LRWESSIGCVGKFFFWAGALPLDTDAICRFIFLAAASRLGSGFDESGSFKVSDAKAGIVGLPAREFSGGVAVLRFRCGFEVFGAIFF
jgi:hypothetical protein